MDPRMVEKDAIEELLMKLKQMTGDKLGKKKVEIEVESEGEGEDDEMSKGMKDEKEHTEDDLEAQKIAGDHLAKDPKYYSKLEKAGLADGEKEDEEEDEDEKEMLLKEYLKLK